MTLNYIVNPFSTQYLRMDYHHDIVFVWSGNYNIFGQVCMVVYSKVMSIFSKNSKIYYTELWFVLGRQVTYGCVDLVVPQNMVMPPSHLTLAKPKSWLWRHGFTPSTLSSHEPSWQMMWHGLKVEVWILKHQPSHRYRDMREECTSLKVLPSAVVIVCF